MPEERRLIQVVPYDPDWPQRFAAEAERLRIAMGDNLATLHHIGSTAVPGLAAKPVIDIIPEVLDIHALDAGLPGCLALEALGYEAVGEYGMPGRRYFRKLEGLQHRVHLHCWTQGHSEIHRHLAVRDYLKGHPAEVAAYAEVKQAAAGRFPHDSQGYQDAKDDFVQALERRAQAWAG